MDVTEVLAEQLRTEAIKAFEHAKQDTSKIFNETTNKVLQKMENIQTSAHKSMQAICDDVHCSKNDAKAKIDTISRENVETVKIMEKEVITTLNTLWNDAKTRIESIYNNSSNVIGNKVKANLKDLVKFLEKVLKECIKTIQAFSKATEKQIEYLAKEMKKSREGNSSKSS